MNKNTDLERFAVAMGTLGSIFGRDTSPEVVDAYWHTLDDLPIDSVEQACRDLAKGAVHFPRPVEIRNFCVRDAQAAAGDAWTEVLRLAKNCREAKHPDPIAERCVRELGGWEHIGTMDIEQFNTWTRKEFLDLYQGKASNPQQIREILKAAEIRAEPLPEGAVGDMVRNISGRLEA